MAEPVWGQLAKAQDDQETIEEALVRLIGEHETDSGAHTGAGGALETHKTQVVVDHPAGSIVEDKLPDEVITTPKIKDLGVTGDKIANLAVTNAKIDSLAVTEAKIANLAVTNAKIDSLAVTNAKIDSLAVTEAKIANLAVTNAKIDSLAVTNAKIDNLAVTEGKIANLAVTNAKINDLNADKITAGTIKALDFRTSAGNKRVCLTATVGTEQHALSFFDSSGFLKGRLSEIASEMTFWAPGGVRFLGAVLPPVGGGYSIGSPADKWSNGFFLTSLQVAGWLGVGGFAVIDSSRNIMNINKVQQNWNPKTPSIYDLGNATDKWRTLYAENAIFYDLVNVGGNLNVSKHLSIIGNGFLNLKAMSGATASSLSAQNGSMYYRTDDHTIRVLLNGSWQTLSTI